MANDAQGAPRVRESACVARVAARAQIAREEDRGTSTRQMCLYEIVFRLEYESAH